MIDLRLGDCLDVMRTMPDASVDQILTSPPYDKLRKYAAGSTFDFPGVADQCKRLLKPGGVLVWVVGDQTIDGGESGTSFRQALHFKSIGLNLHDTMIYEKGNPVPLNHNRYEQDFEYMFVLSKRRPKAVNKLLVPCKLVGQVMPHSTHYVDGANLTVKNGAATPIKPSKPRGNIWRYNNGGDRRRNAGHPAAFPLQLAIDHVLSWTNPGDLVLDCFMGSGTTAEACLRTERNFIGIEISQEYLAIAERRIAAVRESTPLLA